MPGVIVLLLLLMSWLPAYFLNKRFQRRKSGRRPFTWGYTMAIFSLFIGIAALWSSDYLATDAEQTARLQAESFLRDNPDWIDRQVEKQLEEDESNQANFLNSIPYDERQRQLKRGVLRLRFRSDLFDDFHEKALQEVQTEIWLGRNLGLVFVVLSPFIYARIRIAWVVFVILGLNPIAWAINGFYLWNRWQEMKDESRLRRQRVRNRVTRLRQRVSLPSVHARAIVAMAIFWLFAVLTYVLIFDPYGGFDPSDDLGHLILVIASVPILTALGLILWNWVRADQS